MGTTFLLLLAAPVGVQVPNAVPEKPPLICRESENQLGTHIRVGRRCKTEEEWRIDDERRGRMPATMEVTEGQGDALTMRPPP
jgi:hypothetical protein